MIIVLLIAAAPALVPATSRRSCSKRSRIRRSNGVPAIRLVIRSWSPPIMKTPGARSSCSSSLGSSPSQRSAKGAATTSATPIFSNIAWELRSDPVGSSVAAAQTMRRARLPPASFTRRGRIRRSSSSGSSAPPMMSSVPLPVRPFLATGPPLVFARPGAHPVEHRADVVREHQQQIARLHQSHRVGDGLALVLADLDPLRRHPAPLQSLAEEPSDLAWRTAPAFVVLLENHPVQAAAEPTDLTDVLVPAVARAGEYSDPAACVHAGDHLNEPGHRCGVVGVVHQHHPATRAEQVEPPGCDPR